MAAYVDATEMVITLQNGEEYCLLLGENSYPEPDILPRLDGNTILYTHEKKTTQINTVTELIACSLFSQGEENLPFVAAVSVFSFLLGRVTPQELKKSLKKSEEFEAVVAMPTANAEDIPQIKTLLGKCLETRGICVDMNDTCLFETCEAVLAAAKSLEDISKIEIRISAGNEIVFYIPSDILCAERKDRPHRKSVFRVDDVDDITFKDKIFVFTGFLEYEETEKAYDAVWELGGIVKDSFVAKTDYVIVNEEYESPTTKYQKALDAKKKGSNVAVVSARRFFEIVGRSPLQKSNPFIIEKNELKKYIGDESRVTIPYGVVKIANEAFYGNTSIESVVIPEGVTKIGTSAFSGCVSLKNVTMPNSLTKINNNAFRHCSSLVSITIPSGVTAIPSETFFMCVALESISLNEGLIEIGGDNFCGCERLSEITFPSTVDVIMGFHDCSHLKKITFLGAPADLGRVLSNSSIEEAILPEGVKAFTVGSSIRKLSVPGTVENVVADFRECSNLRFNEYENGYYLGNDTSPYVVLAMVKNCDISTISIHPETRVIAPHAFEGCANLLEVDIPNFVVTIGYSAFKGCSSLLKVTIPESVKEIGGYAFAACKNLSVVEAYCEPTSFDDSAFDDCYALANENGFCIVGTVLFNYCGEERDVVIPNGVTKICMFAFSAEINLESIAIPRSVVDIDETCFGEFRYLELRGERGSFAEKYAKKNKIEFRAIPSDAFRKKERPCSREDYTRLFSD